MNFEEKKPEMASSEIFLSVRLTITFPIPGSQSNKGTIALSTATDSIYRTFSVEELVDTKPKSLYHFDGKFYANRDHFEEEAVAHMKRLALRNITLTK